MKTLGFWENRLTSSPCTIECAEMTLLSAHDHEPPVFEGSGRIEIRSTTSITYVMHATARDSGEAFRRICASDQNPYDVQHQFRLRATDYDGVEWNGGWTQPTFQGIPKVGWPLTGQLHGLTTVATGAWVSSEPSVELLFVHPMHLPMAETMKTVSVIGDDEIQRQWSAGRQHVRVLDTDIHVSRSPGSAATWLTAKVSEKLQHPYAENWLSEPLRVLLGQLVYPRLVARNFGDGRAFVSIRPSPLLNRNPRLASIVRGDALGEGDRFWHFYAAYLTYIAQIRGRDGHPQWEINPVTRFYEEVIQASQGSPWVTCLTFASAVEGVAKLLMTPSNGAGTPEASPALRDLIAHIESWTGDRDLRGRAIGSVKRFEQPTVARFLRDAVQRGIIEHPQVRAWGEVRNEVMHGNLTESWPENELKEKINQLSGLLHRLTKALVGHEHH
ncbi:MAG: hypothetical protein JNK02_01960 [Planctomycetes bacterium]|nr:hypothetical protein [Planctomycetota bacterium]